MNTNFTVGQIVMFGRPNGEKTRGKIVKINQKSIKVITIEGRGSKGAAGVQWSVSPNLITPIASDVATVAVKSADPIIDAVIASLGSEDDRYYAKHYGIGFIERKIGLEALLRAAYKAGAASR